MASADELSERVGACVGHLLINDLESFESCVRERTGISWVRVGDVVLRPRSPEPGAAFYVPLLVALSPDKSKVWTVVAQYDFSDSVGDVVLTDVFVDESPTDAVGKVAPEILRALGVIQ